MATKTEKGTKGQKEDAIRKNREKNGSELKLNRIEHPLTHEQSQTTSKIDQKYSPNWNQNTNEKESEK